MLCDRFAHVHVPRTGGSTFRVVVNGISSLRVIDGAAHMTLRDMRERLDPLPPAIGFIRNPWEWYASRWRRLRHLGTFNGPFDEFMKDIERGNISVWTHWTLTNLCSYMGMGEVDYIGRFEQYEDEVVRILLDVIPDLIDETRLRLLIETAGHQRHHPGPGAKECHTQETRDLVARWDRGIIETYGYEF